MEAPPDYHPVGEQPEPKRRKVRKGTQSCWECKRRKIRCTFAASTNAVCNGCRRRGTACISQEFPDEPADGNSQTTDRLARVETLVDQLLKKPSAEGWLGHEALYSREREKIAGPRTLRNSSPSTPVIALHQSPRVDAKYDELSRALIAAWPNQSDLEYILSAPVDFPGLLNLTIYVLYSQDPKTLSPRDILQLPPSGSHPVLIARKLLMLATLLQGAQSGFFRDLGDSRVASCREIMSSAVETAHDLVTCRDELVGSIEGIQCIMIETMYQNHAGKLRRAWLASRRAMLIAQMMGLHRGVGLSSLKIVDVETRLHVNPEYMWARLIQSDRYLSLTLGLPHGSLDDSFATPRALENCAPLERMERISSVAAGRILQRNESDLLDLADTLEIDKLLRKASACMPPQWWLTPNFAASNDEKEGLIDRTMRIMHQFAHYHLLAQLHLPYLLRSSADHRYDYSKITAVSASREVLTRFVSFRSLNAATCYCRGVDCLAFFASATMCFAHLGFNRQRQAGTDGSGTVLEFLAHHRLSDRGLMEVVLEIMEHMARTTKDPIASKITSLLGHLLLIEADVAKGASYTTTPSVEGEPDSLESGGKAEYSRDMLRIYMPHFGNVQIKRGDIPRPAVTVPAVLTGSTPPGEESWAATVPEASNSNQANVADPPEQGQRPQGHTDHQEGPSSSGQHQLQQFMSTTVDNSGADSAELPFPDIVANEDDWALQGVDIAFFDSLIWDGAENDLSGVGMG